MDEKLERRTNVDRKFKKINLISAVLVSLSLCGGCTLEKAGNSSQDQTVQEDNETEQVKAVKSRERRNQ